MVAYTCQVHRGPKVRSQLLVAKGCKHAVVGDIYLTARAKLPTDVGELLGLSLPFCPHVHCGLKGSLGSFGQGFDVEVDELLRAFLRQAEVFE